MGLRLPSLPRGTLLRCNAMGIMSRLSRIFREGAGYFGSKSRMSPSIFQVPRDWRVERFDSDYLNNLLAAAKIRRGSGGRGDSGSIISAGAVKKEPSINKIAWKNLTWVNIERPTRKEMDYLAQNYPFHPLDLDDCLSKVQLPKIDEYESYLFIILHFPVFEHRTRITSASQISIFLGKDFVVTVHNGDLKPFASLPGRCQQDDKVCEQYLGKDSGYLMYRIVDALVDYCIPMVNKTLSNLNEIEDKVFDDKLSASHDVAILRRDIAAQRRVMGQVKGVVGDLERKAQRFTQADLKVYFGDINDHLARLWSNLDECHETIEIYKDTDFLMSQERTNRILAMLTIIFTISIPFTVVGAIYGMNVNLPGGTETGNWAAWGSYTTLIIMLLISGLPALLMLWLFRRWRWL
jgi:magnesium transporter